eukprot:scaffold13215_cov120-Isochrysis_galbana.AAC.6
MARAAWSPFAALHHASPAAGRVGGCGAGAGRCAKWRWCWWATDDRGARGDTDMRDRHLYDESFYI